jgi:hypothetical protein
VSERDSNTYNITRNKLTSWDFLLLTITNNQRLHGNVTLKGGDDIGSLLFLIPSDDGVEKEDTNDDTEINPISETRSEKDSQLHN